MSRESLLIVLSIIIAAAPFIGIPLFWLSILFPVAGLLVALIGITLTRRTVRSQQSTYEIPTNDLS